MGIVTGKFPQLPVFKTIVVLGGAVFLCQVARLMAPISEQARKCNQCVEEFVEFNLMEYDEESVESSREMQRELRTENVSNHSSKGLISGEYKGRNL